MLYDRRIIVLWQQSHHSFRQPEWGKEVIFLIILSTVDSQIPVITMAQRRNLIYYTSLQCVYNKGLLGKTPWKKEKLRSS